MSMFPYLKLYEENEMEFEAVYDKHKNEQNKKHKMISLLFIDSYKILYES
jgi:hypothetical protein